jgi:glycosyltransferase involved in cell wall biosynthesis
VSTAIQENFGLSVIEAVLRGCIPLLPNRLSYPEIIPPRFHSAVLYNDPAQFIKRLAHLITRHSDYARLRIDLARAMERFSWKRQIPQFDDLLDKLAGFMNDPFTEWSNP